MQFARHFLQPCRLAMMSDASAGHGGVVAEHVQAEFDRCDVQAGPRCVFLAAFRLFLKLVGAGGNWIVAIHCR